MKRIKKATLLIIRNRAYRWNFLRTYYWADGRLSELSHFTLMPHFYYRCLFSISMKLVDFNKFQRLADKAIHTIPYHVRFSVA